MCRLLLEYPPRIFHHLITVVFSLIETPAPQSSLVILSRPPSLSSLRIIDRSFRYVSFCLWNQLPVSLRQPRTNLSTSDSDIFLPLACHLRP